LRRSACRTSTGRAGSPRGSSPPTRVDGSDSHHAPADNHS
jgi:hypothetical protein